jgi:hypothetical protein
MIEKTVSTSETKPVTITTTETTREDGGSGGVSPVWIAVLVVLALLAAKGCERRGAGGIHPGFPRPHIGHVR